MPLMATIWPRTMARAAASNALRPPNTASPFGLHNSRCGPQIGQALGCAWKRRFVGSSYSAWHCGHIVNDFIEVLARSYGNDSMMLKRGPQFVQLVNG